MHTRLYSFLGHAHGGSTHITTKGSTDAGIGQCVTTHYTWGTHNLQPAKSHGPDMDLHACCRLEYTLSCTPIFQKPKISDMGEAPSGVCHSLSTRFACCQSDGESPRLGPHVLNGMHASQDCEKIDERERERPGHEWEPIERRQLLLQRLTSREKKQNQRALNVQEQDTHASKWCMHQTSD
jgi:hypothetical protein